MLDQLLKLEIGALYALETVLNQRSVGKAARQAKLSQPGMSHALARLRITFGDRLVVRGNNGLSLTPFGEQLLNQLHEVLPQIERLGIVGGFDPRTSDTTFKIATTDHTALVLLPHILHQIRKQAPGIRVHTAAIQNRQAEVRALEAEQFDLRIGWTRSLPPNWYIKRLIDDDFVIIASTNNRHVQKQLDIDAFETLGHVSLSTEHPTYQTILDQNMRKRGVNWNVVMQVSNFSSMPFIVEHSDLIAIVPNSLARRFQRCTAIRPVRPPLSLGKYPVSMAWHPRVHDNVAHRWLREMIQKYSRNVKDFRKPQLRR